LSNISLEKLNSDLYTNNVPLFSIFQHNARGILSMANSGPNTNGSQFFISYAKQPHLNGLYTVFGKVIHGFEVLDLMEKVCY
jgi:cyclophilin family peptidyl-prolyl cis-trans isomerase